MVVRGRKRRGRKYKTVVMDPPWRVTVNGPNSRPTRGKIPQRLTYKTMTNRQIEQFPIDDFAAKSCKLFIWTIQSRLPFTIDLVKKWGFKYYCTFAWVKNTGVTMQGIFRNHEFVEFGYRGDFDIPFKGKSIPTAFEAKATGHSVKPAEFYQMIRPKTPAPRVDIFARQRHYGFAAWGDQVAARRVRNRGRLWEEDPVA